MQRMRESRGNELALEVSPQNRGALWISATCRDELCKLGREGCRNVDTERPDDVSQAGEVSVGACPIAADAEFAEVGHRARINFKVRARSVRPRDARVAERDQEREQDEDHRDVRSERREGHCTVIVPAKP